MKKKSEEDATIDDIYDIPFVKMLTRVSCEILLAKKTDFGAITDDEKAILDLYQLFRNIMCCLNSIRTAIVFSKRYDKQYFGKNEVNEEQYMTYHYDTIVHKLATIKDLEFKVVAYIYKIPVNKYGNCSWDTISKKREEINNERLFMYFEKESHKAFLLSFDKKRNKSTHDGKLSLTEFKDVSGLLWIRDISNDLLYKDIPGGDYANSWYVSYLIKTSRKETIRHMEQIYKSSINLRYNFFNCLFEDLIKVFTDEVKTNYRNTIADVFSTLKF